MKEQEVRQVPDKSMRVPVFMAVVLLALAILCWYSDPFSKEIAQIDQRISHLSGAQITNITLAAKAIDGVVLKPQETFSFNTTVGPRTQKRGFAPARSYVGDDSPISFGGGICVLSSALYRLALMSDYKIVERKAHTRPITSIEPGFDATVWMPAPDLKFTNTFSYPIRLHTIVTNDTLKVALQAERSRGNVVPVNLMRQETKNGDHLLVLVLRQEASGKRHLITQDVYQLPPDKRPKLSSRSSQ